ncbi:hypothetical protein ACFWPK_28970 [Nocardia sp. NPDC058519]|uniref:hypothetical protein n=1 Tax=Nocardia sp. NPDC058519 TaxID=3346535 RepID=UPI003653022A
MQLGNVVRHELAVTTDLVEGMVLDGHTRHRHEPWAFPTRPRDTPLLEFDDEVDLGAVASVDPGEYDVGRRIGDTPHRIFDEHIDGAESSVDEQLREHRQAGIPRLLHRLTATAMLSEDARQQGFDR